MTLPMLPKDYVAGTRGAHVLLSDLASPYTTNCIHTWALDRSLLGQESLYMKQDVILVVTVAAT